MGRVHKEHDKRRGEILDTAWGLFAERGYDTTTINAIIEKMGISKGAFYHYFSSKEEVLDAAIERITLGVLAEIKETLDDPSRPALDKLNRFLGVSLRWKRESVDVIRALLVALNRDENIMLRHKLNLRSIAIVTPVLADIIAQGVKEGVFDTPHPREVAELILHLSKTMAYLNGKALLEIDDPKELRALVKRRLRVLEESIERLLDAPKGGIKKSSKGLLEIVDKLYAAKEADKAMRRKST